MRTSDTTASALASLLLIGVALLATPSHAADDDLDFGIGARALYLQNFGTLATAGYDRREVAWGLGFMVPFAHFFAIDVSACRKDLQSSRGSVATADLRASFSVLTAGIGPAYVVGADGSERFGWNVRGGLRGSIGPVELSLEGLYLVDNLSRAREEFDAEDDLLAAASATVLF
ncbi:MAG: hypothetical protein HYV63_11055 [Candidatus Schekmanbacteria bacterium]|nr:hypothetical protein [Candidatus Schekmanbacteria bacterium]